MPERGEALRDYMLRIRGVLLPLVNLTGDNRTAYVDRRGGAMTIRAAPAASDEAMDFAWSEKSGTTITMLGGLVEGFTGTATVAGAEVACGGTQAAPHLIVVQGTIDPLEGSILTNSVLESSFTGHSSTVWKRPLLRCYIASGRVVIDRIKWKGCIDLKSWVGP